MTVYWMTDKVSKRLNNYIKKNICLVCHWKYFLKYIICINLRTWSHISTFIEKMCNNVPRGGLLRHRAALDLLVEDEARRRLVLLVVALGRTFSGSPGSHLRVAALQNREANKHRQFVVGGRGERQERQASADGVAARRTM